jgi:hypothetical protein
VAIAEGQARSPSTVAAGGVAFDPLASGTTTISATAAAPVVVVPNATVNVTVNP